MTKGPIVPFFIITGFFSVAVNVLMLVSPLYMLQVYDRVLSSGSLDTLVLVSIAAVGLLVVYGFAEAGRRKVMALLADHIQSDYGPSIFRAGLSDVKQVNLLPETLRDVSIVQSFFQNGLILPLFDLPFTPFFILVMFFIHPVIGWVGVVGVLLLVTIAIVTELISRKPVNIALSAEHKAYRFGEEISRRRSSIISLGMLEPILLEWIQYKEKASQLSVDGASVGSFLSAHARGLRIILQVAVLGIGAWLVLRQQVSAGAIIAGSIIMGRALAPIDQTLGAWRQMVRARKAWKSIQAALQHPDANLKDIVSLPRPQAVLIAENLQIANPGAEGALLPKFNLTINAGTVVVVLGQSGSGKTSLLQTLTGVWPTFQGVVRLGGRDLHRWAERDRGQYVGYVPQDIDLISGTVTQNISRFSEGDKELVIQAAQKAGFHDMILGLPDGYDTKIGTGGVHLSRGQKQAVALSRALYGEPVLLCLDEPSANLDPQLFESLKRSLIVSKEQGVIVILATHDLRLIDFSDQVVILENGSMKMLQASEYMEKVHVLKSSVSV